jgi:hypothetical protein
MESDNDTVLMSPFGAAKKAPENSQTRKAFLPNKGRYGKTIGKMAGLFRILKA